MREAQEEAPWGRSLAGWRTGPGGLGAEGQLTAQPLSGPEGSPPGGLPGGGEWAPTWPDLGG